MSRKDEIKKIENRAFRWFRLSNKINSWLYRNISYFRKKKDDRVKARLEAIL